MVVVSPTTNDAAAPLMLIFRDADKDDPTDRNVDAPDTTIVTLSRLPSTQILEPAATTDAPPTTEMVDAGDANAEDHKFPPVELEDVSTTPDPVIRMVDVVCVPTPS